MNPFLHPAVATPLEPDDVPIWRSDATDATPDAPDDETRPDEAGAGGHAGPASGTVRVRMRHRADWRSLRRAMARPGSGKASGGACGPGTAPACCPARQPSSAWGRRLRSFALASAVGLGICGSAAAQSAHVNANVATTAELETINGIGPKTARNIVSERQRSGPFESFQDFSERIRGIGAKRAAALRDAGLVIGLPASPPTLPATPGPGAGGAPVGVLVR
jgi:competence protein ComEA